MRAGHHLSGSAAVGVVETRGEGVGFGWVIRVG